MRLFARHYPNQEFGQALPDQLTWTHHVVLIHAIEPGKLHIKQWYADKTLENGWPYRELRAQIKNIFATCELAPETTVSKMETVQKEGSPNIKRMISYYN